MTLRQRKIKTYRPIGNLAFGLGKVFQMDFTEYNQVRRYIGILVGVDVLSKKIYTRAIFNNNSNNVVRMLKEDIPKTIKILMSDNGSEFTGTQTQTYLKKHTIRHITGKANTPMSQGLVERANQTIKTMLEKYKIANNTTDWVKALKQITDRYNNTFNRTIMMTPNQVSEENQQEIIERLKSNFPSYKKQKAHFKVGDIVRLRIPKIKDKFSKGYTQNWTRATYKVTKMRRKDGVYMYRVEGKAKPYYKEDLQLANIVEKNPFEKPVSVPKQKTPEKAEKKVSRALKDLEIDMVGHKKKDAVEEIKKMDQGRPRRKRKPRQRE